MDLSDEVQKRIKTALRRSDPGHKYVLLNDVVEWQPDHFRVTAKRKGSQHKLVCEVAPNTDEKRKEFITRRDFFHNFSEKLSAESDKIMPVPVSLISGPNVLVLEQENGQSLGGKWSRATKKHTRLNILDLAARWLGEFQNVAPKVVKFDASPHVNWLDHLIGQHKNGSNFIPSFRTFLPLADNLKKLADDASGCDSVRSVTHRGFSLDCLLLTSSAKVTAINFGQSQEDDAIRDAADLLVASASKHPQFNYVGTKSTAHLQQEVERFFSSLNDQITEPPVRRFFLQFVLLRNWAESGQNLVKWGNYAEYLFLVKAAQAELYRNTGAD